MRPLLLILLISSSAIISIQQSASAAAPATWTSGTPATSICTTGYVYRGEPLTATSGNSGKHSFSWKANNVQIQGATTATYTLPSNSGDYSGKAITNVIMTGQSTENSCPIKQLLSAIELRVLL